MMKAIELISPIFLEINEQEIKDEALARMQKHNVNQLPVVKNGQFLGLIHKQNIATANLSPVHVGPNVHFWDILKFFSQSGANVVPVVAEDGLFIGSITKAHLVNVVSALSAVQSDGAILELLMSPRDYSLSQIAQIVEGNDVKIQSVLVSQVPGENSLMVVLKLDSIHISGVMQTFSRYNIAVRRVYNFTDDQDWLNDRKDALIRFLDI